MVLQDTLLMGSDFFESNEERGLLRETGGIPIGIGKGSTIKKAIIDKNVRIGNNVNIINKDNFLWYHCERMLRPTTDGDCPGHRAGDACGAACRA